MGVTIQSAYLGDEKSRVNVTESVRKKITDSGIEVPVDSSLIPILQVGGEVKLTDADKQEAREKAEQLCGNASDSACMELKTQEFYRQRLAEKENEKTSTANIIKGRRLTVNIEEDGKVSTVEVPEGQVFKLTKKELGSKKLESIEGGGVRVGGPILEVLKVFGIIGATTVYAFSILITYRSFLETGIQWQTYLATAIAVFVPYSGFLIILVWFGLREFIKNIPVKKQ